MTNFCCQQYYKVLPSRLEGRIRDRELEFRFHPLHFGLILMYMSYFWQISFEKIACYNRANTINTCTKQAIITSVEQTLLKFQNATMS